MTLMHISTEFMPPAGLPARILLNALARSPKTLKQIHDLGIHDDRNTINALRGEKYGYWLIHCEFGKDIETTYTLDPLHLTGSKDDDHKARLIQKARYKRKSLKEAEQGQQRLEKAEQEALEAEAELNEWLEPEEIGGEDEKNP